MRKDSIRDYSTSAFRFYAKTGGSKRYIDGLISEAQKRSKKLGSPDPTETDAVRRDEIIRKHAAEFADLEAAERAIAILEKESWHIIRAIEMVYFTDCWKELEKGDISQRVHYAEIHIPAGQSTIYRWLAKARKLFSEERGLRL